MKKIFSKLFLTALFALVFFTPNLFTINKLLIWATVDKKIENKKTINELYNFLEKNHPKISKNIKINQLETPHINIAVAGIIKEENGNKYILNNKNKQVLLEDVLRAVEKAVSSYKLEKKDSNLDKFNLKSSSRFSIPTNEKQFYIIQKPSFGKKHCFYSIRKALKKELSNIGLNPVIFKPSVSSTHICSNDQKTINKLQYLQNYPKFFKILQAIPETKGLTCSNIELVLDKSNSYDIIKTYNLK